MTGEDPDFARRAVPKDVFVRILREVTDVLDENGIPYALIGGVASAIHGRPRLTHDLDLFVRPADARPSLEALDKAGYMTQERDQYWLYKAFKDDVLVDVIFKGKGDIYFDDEMWSRVQRRAFSGTTITVVAPEDLVVIKAIVHDEHVPRHWHDALAVIAMADIDWSYFVRRARHGPARVLSLLLYARSIDHPVPDEVLRSLFELQSGHT